MSESLRQKAQIHYAAAADESVNKRVVLVVPTGYMVEILKATLANMITVAADATNHQDIQLKNGSTVVASVATTAGLTGGAANDMPVTAASRFGVAGDVFYLTGGNIATAGKALTGVTVEVEYALRRTA